MDDEWDEMTESEKRSAAGLDHECSHENDYFDRTVCSCGMMHTRCRDCGEPLDRCAVANEFESVVWERLEPWLIGHRAELSIYPAYPLSDGGWGPWTARVVVQRRSGKQNRYDRVAGEGPGRLSALRELVFKLMFDE